MSTSSKLLLGHLDPSPTPPAPILATKDAAKWGVFGRSDSEMAGPRPFPVEKDTYSGWHHRSENDAILVLAIFRLEKALLQVLATLGLSVTN